MPARKLPSSPRPPIRDTFVSLHSPSRSCNHMNYGQLEDTITPTILPSQEFIPNRAAAAHSVAYSQSAFHSTESPDVMVNSPTFGNKLESLLIRLSDCCSSHRCTGASIRGNTQTDPSIDRAPLLSSSSSHLTVDNPSIHDSEENEGNINIEVVGWMQRRLAYFFMTPLEKYQAKGRVPFKLFIQLLKVIFVTIQLVEFGFSRSSHVAFGENTRLALSHLYLREWDSQYETLDYPPAAGPYAVYEKSDFYENIGFALARFNRTQELAIGAYVMESSAPHVKLCLTNISGILDRFESSESPESGTYCVDVFPSQIPSDSVTDAEQVEKFLQSKGLTVDFSRLLHFQLRFVVLSPVITHLDWAEDPECFKFNVVIHMERLKQSGLMKIDLKAPYTGTFCAGLTGPNMTNEPNILSQSNHASPPLLPGDPVSQIRNFWAESHSTGMVERLRSTRRIMVVALNSLVLLLSMTSFVLCIRSLIRGFVMWKETMLFFENWFSIRLCGVFWDFFRAWFLVILVNDLMIVTSALYNLRSMSGYEHQSEPISYVFGISALLVWSGVLRYIGFSYQNSILMRTIISSIPALLRFCVCALILFFAFSLCGWVVLGPYNLKFRSFMSTIECLFSLLNGDDMFVTFSIINDRDPMGIYLFSRLFLYVFVTLFIYVVLNLFITIIFEAYEGVKELQHADGRQNDSALWTFILTNRVPPHSPLYKMDDRRSDRHVLLAYALGRAHDGQNVGYTQDNVPPPASPPAFPTDLDKLSVTNNAVELSRNGPCINSAPFNRTRSSSVSVLTPNSSSSMVVRNEDVVEIEASAEPTSGAT